MSPLLTGNFSYSPFLSVVFDFLHSGMLFAILIVETNFEKLK
jgi:hypothetical protein